MSEVELHVKIREKTGKQVSKALRRDGEIPAVYYAHDQKAVPLSVNAHKLSRLLHQEVNILNIVFPDGKTKKSIIRDLQKDPVTDQLLHIDFLGIKLDEKIKMTIPIILAGTPVGVKLEGGILEHPLRPADHGRRLRVSEIGDDEDGKDDDSLAFDAASARRPRVDLARDLSGYRCLLGRCGGGIPRSHRAARSRGLQLPSA